MRNDTGSKSKVESQNLYHVINSIDEMRAKCPIQHAKCNINFSGLRTTNINYFPNHRPPTRFYSKKKTIILFFSFLIQHFFVSFRFFLFAFIFID